MTKIPDHNLFFRYLEGTCTKSERERIEQWLMEDPSHADEFEQFVTEHSEAVSIDNDRIERDLFRNINQISDDPLNLSSLPAKRFSLPSSGGSQKRTVTHWVAAAVILIILASSTIIHLWLTDRPEVEDPVFVERTIPAGKSAMITLPDGSRVRLNAESRLRFPEKFSSTAREVFLEGEAFFEVAAENNRPFHVYANYLKTTVLGTAFNVKAYPAGDAEQVTVVHGKVSVEREEADGSSLAPVILEPDQWATYHPKSGELKKEEGDVQEFIAWKDGVLLFHDKRVSEVVKMLERWYNTEITVKNETVKNCLIHGEHKNESLENVLKTMQFTLDINYAFTEEGVTITGGRCI